MRTTCQGHLEGADLLTATAAATRPSRLATGRVVDLTSAEGARRTSATHVMLLRVSDLDAPFDETAGQRLKRLVAHWQATKEQATASELFRLLSPRMHAQAWHLHPDAHMRQEFVAE